MNTSPNTSHDINNMDHQSHIPLNDISPALDGAPPTYNQPHSQNEKTDSALPRQPEPTHPMTYSNANNHPTGSLITIKQLESAPAPVQCPICHQIAMTRVDFHSGGTTYGWSALGCLICAIPLACIPFAVEGTKNVDHMCGSCGTKLATWHRSGRTEVWAHEGMHAAPSATMKK